MAAGLTVSGDRLAAFCRRRRIRRLAFFGSVLRPDFRPDSDVDMLVEFEPASMPGLLGMARMGRELSQLLGGRKFKVDPIVKTLVGVEIR